MNSNRRCLATMICVFLSAPIVLAYDCSRTASRVEDGWTQTVTTVGDLAVVSAGSRLVLYDLTDPSGTAVVGDMTGDGHMKAMASLGNHVLTAVSGAEGHRLDVVDVSSPEVPVAIASVPLHRTPSDIAVRGDYAWLVADFGGLGFGLGGLDLSDPHQPVVGAHVPLAGSSFISKAAVDGDLVYVSTNNSGLHIIDISDPDVPSEIGFLAIDGPWTVAAKDQFAYVATIERVSTSFALVVHVIDARHPANPVEIASASVSIPADLTWPGDMAVAGNFLYVGMIRVPDGVGVSGAKAAVGLQGGGLAVFDISDPSDPYETSAQSFADGCNSLAIGGNRLVAADIDRGLRVFDLAQPSVPVELSRRNITYNNVYAVAVEGDLAFVGDQGLRIFNLAGPLRPELLGSLEHDDETLSVAVGEAGLRILTVGSAGAVSVIDGANPFEPVETHRLETDGEATDVAIRGTLGAVADGAAGLLLLDLADLSSPVVVGSTPTSGAATAVALWDDLAVVGLADPTPGLAVFDIADPSQPVILAQLSIPHDAVAVDIQDDLAALLSAETIHLVDLTNPAAPVISSARDIPWGDGMDAALSGGRALVASYPGNLLHLDIDDPAVPAPIANHVWMPAIIVDGPLLGGWGVGSYQGLGVVADGGFGLRIVDFGNCRRMQRLPAPPVSVD